MNKVILIGNIVADPEVRVVKYGDGEFKTAAYRIAVSRRRTKSGEDPKTDFIRCECFRGNAEFAEKYLRKGTRICVTGRIATDSYTKEDGTTVYKTYVAVDEHEFVGPKKSDDASAPAGGSGAHQDGKPTTQPQAAAETFDYGDASVPGFSEIESLDEELPF